MNVFLEDLSFFKFGKILKYILLRKNIYYLCNEVTTYNKFIEILFFKKIKPFKWKFSELTDSKGMNLYWSIMNNDFEKFLKDVTDFIFTNNKHCENNYIKLYVFRVLSRVKVVPFPFSKFSYSQLLFIICSLSNLHNNNFFFRFITNNFKVVSFIFLTGFIE